MGEGRVLELLGPSTGGIRRHVEELTARLRERGWDVTVAGVETVPVPSGPNPAAVVAARRRLTEVVAETGAELVHAHGLKAAWVASTVPRRPPLVATVHNLVLDEVAGLAARPLRFLEGLLPRRVDRLIAVSDEIGVRFGADVPVVRPIGPPPAPTRSREEVRSALGIPSDRPLVVAVARLHPQKDLPTLLRALQRLPTVSGVIVGEGPLDDELRREVASLGLGDRVQLPGPSPEAASELAAADVVVVSSRWESGPLVLAEALLLERPVVTTPVGFAPELVTDGVTGRMVPVGDDAAMAAAIADLLADRERAQRMAAEGRSRAEALLGPERLVSPIEDIYRAMLNR